MHQDIIGLSGKHTDPSAIAISAAPASVFNTIKTGVRLVVLRDSQLHVIPRVREPVRGRKFLTYACLIYCSHGTASHFIFFHNPVWASMIDLPTTLPILTNLLNRPDYDVPGSGGYLQLSPHDRGSGAAFGWRSGKTSRCRRSACACGPSSSAGGRGDYPRCTSVAWDAELEPGDPRDAQRRVHAAAIQGAELSACNAL
jgi:hypothetical protein